MTMQMDGKRSPDATLFHPAQPKLPTVVIEVAYSQHQKDMPRLAESYIIDSSHAIQAVVGFKIPYLQPVGQAKSKSNADKTAWLSIWRPGIDRSGEDDIGIVSSYLHSAYNHPSSSSSAVHGVAIHRAPPLRLMPSQLQCAPARQTRPLNRPLLLNLPAFPRGPPCPPSIQGSLR